MSARTITDRIDTHLRVTRQNIEAALSGLTGEDASSGITPARVGLLGSLDDLADVAEACRTLSDQLCSLLHSLPDVDAKVPMPEYALRR